MWFKIFLGVLFTAMVMDWVHCRLEVSKLRYDYALSEGVAVKAIGINGRLLNSLSTCRVVVEGLIKDKEQFLQLTTYSEMIKGRRLYRDRMAQKDIQQWHSSKRP